MNVAELVSLSYSLACCYGTALLSNIGWEFLISQAWVLAGPSNHRAFTRRIEILPDFWRPILPILLAFEGSYQHWYQPYSAACQTVALLSGPRVVISSSVTAVLLKLDGLTWVPAPQWPNSVWNHYYRSVIARRVPVLLGFSTIVEELYSMME